MQSKKKNLRCGKLRMTQVWNFNGGGTYDSAVSKSPGARPIHTTLSTH
jgi:hypothetical protein